MKNINEITKAEASEVKYILTDIDGTLTGPDGRISPKTYEMLWKLREAGFVLIPVTGRTAECNIPHKAGTALAGADRADPG